MAAALWVGTATEPVELRLARKLRLLASRGAKRSISATALLKEHARGIEFLRHRSVGLEAGMATRDATIASLQHRLDREVEAHDAQARILEASIAQLMTHEHALHAKAATAAARIAALQSSLSWRLTRPIRTAVRAISRRTFRR